VTNEPSVGVVGGLPWRPERLRAERRVNPLGVGTAHPWLDWRLPAEAEDATPAGYRVRVATSVTGLAEPDALGFRLGGVHRLGLPLRWATRRQPGTVVLAGAGACRHR
jgi:hypothetical protein